MSPSEQRLAQRMLMHGSINPKNLGELMVVDRLVEWGRAERTSKGRYRLTGHGKKTLHSLTAERFTD